MDHILWPFQTKPEWLFWVILAIFNNFDMIAWLVVQYITDKILLSNMPKILRRLESLFSLTVSATIPPHPLSQTHQSHTCWRWRLDLLFDPIIRKTILNPYQWAYYSIVFRLICTEPRVGCQAIMAKLLKMAKITQNSHSGLVWNGHKIWSILVSMHLAG